MLNNTTAYHIDLETSIDLAQLIKDQYIRLPVERDVPCDKCRGARVNGAACVVCHNTQVKVERRHMSLKIPPGHLNNTGMQLTYNGLGHFNPIDGSCGNLHLKVMVTKSDDMTLQGKDITRPLMVTPLQAFMGGGVTLETLEGPLKRHIDKPLFPGTRWRMAGKGGYVKEDKERGDLFFEIRLSPSDNEDLAVKKIQSLQGELQEITGQYDKLEKQHRQTQADFQAEKALSYNKAVKSMVEALLPSIDGLEKALTSLEGEHAQSHREGIAMILDQQRKALADHGVFRIAARGRRFDPHLHEAVAVTTVSGVEKGMVTEVLQEGYLFQKRLIRPAMVKVSGH